MVVMRMMMMMMVVMQGCKWGCMKVCMIGGV